MRLAGQGATILPADAAAVKNGQRRACFGKGDRLDAPLLLVGEIRIGGNAAFADGPRPVPVPYPNPPASVVISQTLPAVIIEECLRLELINVRPHALGDLVHASQAQASLLAYFRNNVIHLFALQKRKKSLK